MKNYLRTLKLCVAAMLLGTTLASAQIVTFEGRVTSTTGGFTYAKGTAVDIELDLSKPAAWIYAGTGFYWAGFKMTVGGDTILSEPSAGVFLGDLSSYGGGYGVYMDHLWYRTGGGFKSDLTLSSTDSGLITPDSIPAGLSLAKFSEHFGAITSDGTYGVPIAGGIDYDITGYRGSLGGVVVDPGTGGSSPVPEPSTYGIVGALVLAVGLVARRRK